MAIPAFALITGASSGIGECFARALAARKKNVVLVARSQEKLQALAGELGRGHGITARPLVFDLSRPGAAQELVRALAEQGFEINLLVNNAGSGARGEFWKLSLDRQTEIVRLNVFAPLELTHLLLPAMIEKRRGAIINVSSTAGFQPVPYTATYAATKAFLTSFSLALEEEVRAYGVTVVTLCPGGTRTNFFQASQYGMRKFPGGLQPPEKVVEAALGKLDRGGGLVVPGTLNKLGVVSQRIAPRGLVTKFAATIFRP